MTETYKVGDKVRYTHNNFGLGGAEGVVEEYVEGSTCPALVNFKSPKTTWWCSLAHLELIKEVTMEIPKVYKVVHIDGDGGYSSVFCGQPCAMSTYDKNPKLSYRVGEVTVAPKTSNGIYCQPDFDKAKRHADGTACLIIERPTTILEVEPITIAGQCWRRDDRPLAVKVIREVWREEPKEEPKFKVGDKVVATYAASTGEVFTVDHTEGNKIWFTKGTWLGESQIRLATDEELRPEPKFKIGDRVKVVGVGYTRKEDFTIALIHWGADNPYFRGHAHWHYGFKIAGYYDPEGYFIDEGHLELAPPKEEWVDVTKECELKFLDNYPYSHGGTTIEIAHHGSFIARLGIGLPSLVGGCGRYKIEEITHNYIGQMSTFKVLEKVMK